jgi:hypothetical protein
MLTDQGKYEFMIFPERISKYGFFRPQSMICIQILVVWIIQDRTVNEITTAATWEALAKCIKQESTLKRVIKIKLDRASSD